MPEGSFERSEYIQLRNQVLDGILDFGCEVAWEKSRMYGAMNNIPAGDLMEAASIKLAESILITEQHAGMIGLQWQAKHHPEVRRISNLVTVAYGFASLLDREEDMHRCMEYAQLHFRNTVKQEEFEPDEEFVSYWVDLMYAMGSLETEDQWQSSVEEFAPYIVSASAAYYETSPRPVVSADGDADSLDASEIDTPYDVALSLVAIGLTHTNPELADRAYSLISHQEDKETVDAKRLESEMVRQFNNGDLQAVQTILTGRSTAKLAPIWKAIASQVLAGEEEAVERSNRVLNTVLESRPRYFADLDHVDRSEGRALGKALALLGRLDILQQVVGILNPEATTNITAKSAALGFGIRENHTGFEFLLTRTDHFDDTGYSELYQNYATGVEIAKEQKPDQV